MKHKNTPIWGCFCVQGEGQGGGGGKHVEHARLGVFYGFEGKGRMREAIVVMVGDVL